ncbi:hypothetical protein JCM15765_23740 [Paradesulfitobacterium aromaticivorans]
MGVKAGVRHYFAEGLTSRGYISLLPVMMPNWERTYVLLGGPGTGKSTLIKVIGLELLDRGYGLDFFRSARDPDSIAGFTLTGQGYTMLDTAEIAPLQWRAPGVVEKFFDLGAFCDERKLSNQRQEILAVEDNLVQLQTKIEESLSYLLANYVSKRADHMMHEAFPLYNPTQWGFSKGESGPWSLVQNALHKLQKSIVTPCFLHSVTPDGWLNLAPHFLTEFDQILLEGEETLEALNWFLREAQLLGQVIEVVLHPLNPNEIIGIVFPERNLAIWQGDPETLADQNLAQPLSANLKETLRSWYDQRSLLKSIYVESVDFSRVDALREDLLNRILRELDFLPEQGRV